MFELWGKDEKERIYKIVETFATWEGENIDELFKLDSE